MPTFTFADAADIVAPLTEQIRAEHAVRRGYIDREAARSRGVCMSGMGPDPYREPTDEEIDAEARARAARIEAFRASPRGRFIRALKGLEARYPIEAETARAAYSRGFANDQRQPCPREVGRALEALNAIAGNHARAARQALAELLQVQMAEAA